jgi:hypothetical protein
MNLKHRFQLLGFYNALLEESISVLLETTVTARRAFLSAFNLSGEWISATD